MSYCDVKNATVGQLQPTAGAQFCKSYWFLVVVWRDHDAGGVDVFAHRSGLAYPDAADQHFRHSDHVHQHLPGHAGQENVGGRSMMRIGWIQMSDEHTCVQCNHAGQSALSSAR